MINEILSSHLNPFSDYDFVQIRERLASGPRVTNLLPIFEKIASGETQVPKINTLAANELLDQRHELSVFHEIFQENLGTFLRHGCASIPYLLEEILRIGVSIYELALFKNPNSLNTFNFYETS